MPSYQKSLSLYGNSSRIYGTLYGPQSKRASLKVAPLVQTLDVDLFLNFLNEKKRPVLLPPGTPTQGEKLRSLIDEWLESGTGDGDDDPRRRNFETAKNVRAAVYDYSARGKIYLLGIGDILHLRIDEYEFTPKFGLGPLLAPALESYASERLTLFLLSDLRFSLAKCRSEECRKYFELKHWKRLYKNGTFCDTCQRKRSQESAKRATAQEREDVRVALHVAAAKRFRKDIIANHLWYSNDVLKRKVATFLSDKFGEEEAFCAAYPKGITGKWVANVKNWKPIDIAAKGGK